MRKKLIALLLIGLMTTVGCFNDTNEVTDEQNDEPIINEEQEETESQVEETDPVDVVKNLVEIGNTEARSEEDPLDIDSYMLADYTDNFGTIHTLQLSTYYNVELEVLNYDIGDNEAEVRGVLLKESETETKDNEYTFYLEFKTTMDFDEPRWLVTDIRQETGHMQ